jgi:hypothetical protein
MAESQSQAIENAGNFVIAGRNFTVTNPKARMSLQKAEEAI